MSVRVTRSRKRKGPSPQKSVSARKKKRVTFATDFKMPMRNLDPSDFVPPGLSAQQARTAVPAARRRRTRSSSNAAAAAPAPAPRRKSKNLGGCSKGNKSSGRLAREAAIKTSGSAAWKAYKKRVKKSLKRARARYAARRAARA